MNVSTLADEDSFLLAWRKIRHRPVESPHVPQADDHQKPDRQPFQRTSSVMPKSPHGGGILTDLRREPGPQTNRAILSRSLDADGDSAVVAEVVEGGDVVSPGL